MNTPRSPLDPARRQRGCHPSATTRSWALTGTFAVLLSLPLLAGCSSSDDDEAKALANSTVPPVEEIYNNALDSLNKKKYTTANAQFDRVEQNYPYSTWAVNAQLMAGYTQYQQNKYTDAIGTLDHFIQLHPAHRDIAYVYYLRALCYYEQIADVQRDQKGTEEAMKALQEVVNRFPDSSYATDARFKIDLARDHMAGHEMVIGRWYQNQNLLAAAMGRYQRVVDDYQTTNHVPEALHRLTEVYLALGLKEQARKTASVLGYNYPGSRWYEDSYNDLLDDRLINEPGAARSEAQPPPRGFFARAWNSVF